MCRSTLQKKGGDDGWGSIYNNKPKTNVIILLLDKLFVLHRGISIK